MGKNLDERKWLVTLALLSILFPVSNSESQVGRISMSLTNFIRPFFMTSYFLVKNPHCSQIDTHRIRYFGGGSKLKSKEWQSKYQGLYIVRCKPTSTKFNSRLFVLLNGLYSLAFSPILYVAFQSR